jgi:hypothetical protein
LGISFPEWYGTGCAEQPARSAHPSIVFFIKI